MRALHVCWSYPSEYNRAAGSFFRNMVEGLQAAGVDCTVVTPVPSLSTLVARFGGNAKGRCFPGTRYRFSGVEVYAPRYIRLPFSHDVGLTPVAMAAAIRRLELGNFEIVHGHFACPFGLVAVSLAKAWGAASVVTLHGSDVNDHPNDSVVRKRQFVSAVSGADLVLSVSDELAQRTQQIAGTRPTTLPIGIALSRFRPVRSRIEARRLLGLPEGQKIVMYAGALIPEKGIVELVSAASILPSNITVMLIGDGPLRPTLERARNVLFIGPVPNDKLVEYLTASDGFVLPTYAEGMPTVLIEAGAARIPVAASSVCSIPNLLKDQRGLLFPPRDVRALSQSIRDLVEDPIAAGNRAERLYHHICECHDANRNSMELMRLYTSVTRLTH